MAMLRSGIRALATAGFADSILQSTSTVFSPPLVESIEVERPPSKRYCVAVFQGITGMQGLEQEDGWMSLHSLRI